MKSVFFYIKDIGNEFQKFALRGNVIDLAVGIMVGAAFGKIVNSLVTDIVMPPIGFVMGRVDFSEFFVALSSTDVPSIEVAKELGITTINYGLFINALIAFIITALAVFVLVKAINKIKDKYEKKPPVTETSKPCPFCFSSISKQATRCPFCTSEIPKDN